MMQRIPVSFFLALFLFLHFHIIGPFLNTNSSPVLSEVNCCPSTEDKDNDKSPDLEYRFEILDNRTPIDIELNSDVQRYIDLFLNQRHGDIEIALQRAQLYFPLIEQYLDKYDLPLELKYLAVVESGLNPNAKSKSGAVGIWQFLYATCSLFDLEVDSYIDERRDPFKSTEAACKYLSYLYRTYNDWTLAMASYNGGPGDVRKAIERSGGKTDYWDIRPYLSEQARNYVPAFMAVYYLMTYSKLYNFRTSPPEFSFENTDTLMISYAVSFKQIASVINIPIPDLNSLNPVYRRGYIPKRDEPCMLVLPKKLIPTYLRNQSRILATLIPRADYTNLLSNAGSTADKNRIVHVVKRGEFCHKIALNYNCTIENIKAWNNLTSTTLYPGQTLEIWVSNQ